MVNVLLCRRCYFVYICFIIKGPFPKRKSVLIICLIDELVYVTQQNTLLFVLYASQIKLKLKDKNKHAQQNRHVIKEKSCVHPLAHIHTYPNLHVFGLEDKTCAGLCTALLPMAGKSLSNERKANLVHWKLPTQWISNTTLLHGV